MWVPNSAAASCSGCRAGFSMTRRRHHCRSCGMLFCSSCVPPVLSRSLPHLSYNEAVRVCVPCLVKWTSFESNGSSPLEQRNSTLTPGAAGGPADTRGTPSNSFHAFNMQGEVHPILLRDMHRITLLTHICWLRFGKNVLISPTMFSMH